MFREIQTSGKNKTAHMFNIDGDLVDQIRQAGVFDESACLSCGHCTALCPAEIAIPPRVLFRYALLGTKDRLVESSDTISSCLLCKKCQDSCPSGVKITENMKTLRSYLKRRGHQS